MKLSLLVFEMMTRYRYYKDTGKVLLNQARTSRRPARAWFLEIDLVREVCVCVSVCPPLRLVITSGVIWRDMDPI